MGSSAPTGTSAAGSSGKCKCPPLETEADAAAAQAYGGDYFAICLSIKVRQPSAASCQAPCILHMADTHRPAAVAVLTVFAPHMTLKC